MRYSRGIVTAVIIVAFVQGVRAQPGPDRDAAWSAFTGWFRTAPLTRHPLVAYADKLKQDGKAELDVQREIGVLTGLLSVRSDWIGIHFDRAYGRPLTGDPSRDGFSTRPSDLLVDSIKGVKPGAALDAGMGQGRNAVYLA
ncbi:MAG TPA: hypothetical protein VGK32_15480 [Vicinamibacterales bacterium]|jgi:hypothetical protein